MAVCEQVVKQSCEILKIEKLGMFLFAELQPAVPQQNGGYHSIQLAKQVQGAPLTNFLNIVMACQRVVKFVWAKFFCTEFGNAFCL
jgi:hypothetical protein